MIEVTEPSVQVESEIKSSPIMRFSLTFAIPNCCSICERLFDDKEVLPFDDAHAMCDQENGVDPPMRDLLPSAGKSHTDIMNNLLAEYLDDPSLKRLKRVCKGCFERTVLHHVSKEPGIAFRCIRYEDRIWLINVACPFCWFEKRDRAFQLRFRR